jgi:alpha-L-arabinofuranosidase
VIVRLADRDIVAVRSGEQLTGPSPKAANSFDRKDLVRPQPFTDAIIRGREAIIQMPPLSFAAITLEIGS